MGSPSGTDLARFERSAHDLLEIRLKPATRIDAAAVAAIMGERMRLCGKEPVCVLVLVPADAELDIGVMSMDHYKLNDSAEGLRALAVVSEGLMVETMTRLYLAYFPPMFRAEVFNQEDQARTWLDEQLAELRSAGQKA